MKRVFGAVWLVLLGGCVVGSPIAMEEGPADAAPPEDDGSMPTPPPEGDPEDGDAPPPPPDASLCGTDWDAGAPEGERLCAGCEPICPDCEDEGRAVDYGVCRPGDGTPIDVDAAIALGFTGLNLLSRSFELPLAWTPVETESGQPAAGYEPTTTIHGETCILKVEHIPPPAASCEDTLSVTLGVTLSTGDGALATGGELRVTLIRADAVPFAYGSFDLMGATGALQLFPDPWSRSPRGTVDAQLYFWPQGVRGALSVGLLDATIAENVITVHDTYYPLDARFPIDGCEVNQWPVAPDQPGVTPDGGSALDMRDALVALLGTAPFHASWSDAAPTNVVTTIGQPSVVCLEQGRGISYSVPLEVTSSDGRVHLNELARAWTSYAADDSFENAWIEYYPDTVIQSSDFEATSGVSGVDFGSVPAARFYVDLYLASTDRPEPYGALVVEGVDSDGQLTGIEGAVLDPLATLSWSR